MEINETARVVIVEDDPVMSRFLFYTLENNGYFVREAATGERGLILLEEQNPVVALVDMNLPDMTGLELIGRLRAWSQVPVIVITADGNEDAKVAALDGGADDYVTKPFNVPELLARIRAAVRRNQSASRDGNAAICRFGKAEINLARHIVTVDGAEVRLSQKQYDMLALLAKHAGQIVTHTQILKSVWGPAYATETNYLRIYIKQLRDKLEADPSNPKHLMNEPGIGYRLLTD